MFIDREPKIFEHIIEYLNYDQRFLPEVDKQTWKKIELELKYWDLQHRNQGEADRFKVKLNKMFDSLPEISQEASTKALNIW